MEKERSKLELWLIVEENFERIYDELYERYGICNVINILRKENKLSEKESIILKNIIREYKDKRGRFFNMYAWKSASARKPRRMFIQKQILKAIRDNGTV